MSVRRKQPQRTSQSHSYSPLPAYGAVAFLIVAAAASATMAAKHIWAISLPGCGQGGGCDWAIRSSWSSFFGWPTAFIGVAFFAALLLIFGLTIGRGRCGVVLFLARLGVLGSLALLAVMLFEGHFCIWCLTTHVANLGWWLSLEFGLKSSATSFFPKWKDIALSALVFIVIAASCKLLEVRERAFTQAVASEAALRSLAQMGEPTSPAVNSRADSTQTPALVPFTRSRNSARFGGRYWTGSAEPKVRVVMFHDYQCQLCKEAEGILVELLKSRTDLSLSIKQWPFDKDCNPNILAENVHPGACFAARCAEAAGLVGGDSAFWNIHRWLVEQNGEVTIETATKEVARLGIDPAPFQQALQDPRIDSMIRADIQEGVNYGIKFTPMLFVNGYEVQGWQSAGMLPAAIERASQFARTQPKQNDQPDLAANREFQEWLAKPMTTIPIRKDDHLRGPISAPAAVVMFGDISDPYNAVAYKLLEPLIRDTSKVCFIFRVFPLQSECNDMVKRPINPRACESARLLEAVALVGGEQSFRKAHRWLTANVENLPTDLIGNLASACGLDRSRMTTATGDPRIDARIGENVEAAKMLGVNTSPTIFINGRIVPNWRTPGLLQRILAKVAQPSH